MVEPDISLIWLVPVGSLVLGMITGWLCQRSGFCSIGGMRDFILFRQTRLLKGFIALLLSAFAGYFIFSLIWPEAYGGFFWVVNNGFTAIGGAPHFATVTATVICMVVGGLCSGIIGVLAGGCPLRHLVLTAEGSMKSLFFFIGLLAAVLVFMIFLNDLIVSFFAFFGL